MLAQLCMTVLGALKHRIYACVMLLYNVSRVCRLTRPADSWLRYLTESSMSSVRTLPASIPSFEEFTKSRRSQHQGSTAACDTAAQRRVYVETYGCQMNGNDTGEFLGTSLVVMHLKFHSHCIITRERIFFLVYIHIKWMICLWLMSATDLWHERALDIGKHNAEILLGILGQQGYVETPDPEGASVILLNTCSIRDKAEQKVFSRIGELKRLTRYLTIALLLTSCPAPSNGPSLTIDDKQFVAVVLEATKQSLGL